MRTGIVVTFLLGLLAGASLAIAEEAGSIRGTVQGPYDENVRYAPIQATNVSTGTKVRTQSERDGSFEFVGLPMGTYTLKVKMHCCAYAGFDSDEIEVIGRVAYDIQLAEGPSFNTLGDDPGIIAATIKDRQVIPNEPVPRMANGKPDLSGVWLVGSDPFPEKPDAKPWAQEIRDERVANNFRYHPHNSCLPGGPPITGGAAPFIAKFVHQDDLLVILLEDVGGYRQVFLDGRAHPEWPNPSWLGHSVGHWEDDILVINTVGFNDRGWTSGYPRSEEFRTVERYKRTEYGRLELVTTFDDPEVFNKSWTENTVLDLAPQEELIEYVCENNKWAVPEDVTAVSE